MEHIHNNAFRDVRNYPEKFLKIIDDKLTLPVTYKKSLNDGFATRGWKLDATIGVPQIISSTRETGESINTSAFVHDILDHFLSGFGVSGHRSEAMALIQLSKRTCADPRTDYEQIIREDILNGYVNGEPFMAFLPDQITELLPFDIKMADREISTFLKQNISANYLKAETGLALQALLERIDSEVERAGIDLLEGFVSIDNSRVAFTAKENDKH